MDLLGDVGQMDTTRNIDFYDEQLLSLKELNSS
jgi:hypothetical protein